MHLVHPWQKGQEAEAYRYQSLLNFEVNWGAVEKKKDVQIIWVRSRRPAHLTTWPCYHSVRKPGNKTGTPRDLIHLLHWYMKWIIPLIWHPLQQIQLKPCFEAIWYSRARDKLEILWKTMSSLINRDNNGQIEKGMNLTWQHALIPISSLSTYLVSWDNSPVPKPGHNLKW